MEQVFITLLNASITAGYLVLAVLLLRPILKKAPKFIRCILWGLVGIRLVLPFSLESILSLIPNAEPIPSEIVTTATPTVQTGLTFFNHAVNPILIQSMAPAPTDTVTPMQIFMGIAWKVWLAGMIAMVIYSVFSFLLLKRKLREGVTEGGNIWLCDRISSPFLLGLFRPRIYLPSDLADADKDYVLAHERAHIRRKDHWWKPLGFLLLTVYWFNPLMWVAYIFLCRDIEFACDEKVIKELGDDHKASYSQSLIRCSVPKKMISACPVAFGEEGIKGRIKSVLNYKKPAFWIILIAIFLCIVVAVCFLTNPPKTEESQNTPTNEYRFRATVVEIYDDSLLVKPLEGTEMETADRILVEFPPDHSETYTVGDWVQIHYDGMIQELYPAIIPNTIAIYNLQALSSYIGQSTEFNYGPLAETEFDIDHDGIVESCSITCGPTSGLFTIVFTAYENGIPEYQNIFNINSCNLSFRTEADGITVLVGTPSNESKEEKVFDISIQDEQIVLSDGMENALYWGGFSENTLSAVRKKYPHFLGLSAFKGLEVYVWKNGDWRCGVRGGTNRNATQEELQAFGEGATLWEMAVILSAYGITRDEVAILYSYDPAFSGEYTNQPSEEQQAYIEDTLFTYLPQRIVAEPYIAPEFQVQKPYELIIYTYKMSENGWLFRFYEKTTIAGSVKDAVMGLNGLNLEAARKKLAQYALSPEEIPVIPISSYISSYHYEINEQTVIEARKLLGLT